MIYSGKTPTVSYSATPDGSFVAIGLTLTLSGWPFPDTVTQSQTGLQRHSGEYDWNQTMRVPEIYYENPFKIYTLGFFLSRQGNSGLRQNPV